MGNKPSPNHHRGDGNKIYIPDHFRLANSPPMTLELCLTAGAMLWAGGFRNNQLDGEHVFLNRYFLSMVDLWEYVIDNMDENKLVDYQPLADQLEIIRLLRKQYRLQSRKTRSNK
ncbi:hypothetical protein I2494_20035 [Budviciaceae bacterium BWR-B9]|uniref:Uncharacterized protein n=1 Tax=Limnobaculum allomyrinae TaxID=2791986 RepID=A0ABS1IWK4_9GAMM|nr:MULTISPECIES: hypothetical protein [Limnobaculum]MBK5145962.1 hypothetical protein [Limnobaculum allomyrinae]MBV7693983.1 hypothetical protein [Limnobaculum sp. M2-1]